MRYLIHNQTDQLVDVKGYPFRDYSSASLELKARKFLIFLTILAVILAVLSINGIFWSRHRMR